MHDFVLEKVCVCFSSWKDSRVDLTWATEEVQCGLWLCVVCVGTGGHFDLSCRVTQEQEEEMRSVSVKYFYFGEKKKVKLFRVQGDCKSIRLLNGSTKDLKSGLGKYATL